MIKTNVLILAGGKSTRMGQNKMNMRLEDKETMPARLIREFSERFENIYISVAEDKKPADINLPRERFITDIFPGHGPISGLHAALTKLKTDIFLVAGDMPFADPKYAEEIIDAAAGFDACLAGTEDLPEPLFALYRPSVLPALENAIKSERNSLYRAVKGLNVRFIEIPERILTNVNTPEEFEAVKLS